MSDKASQDLAAYIRKHPEVLSLLPKGQSEELDALCKQFADQLSVDPDFMRKHGAVVSPGAKRRERPADIAEHRHRVRCTVPGGGTLVDIPLAVDAAWFVESCVGIHSTRVLAIEQEDGHMQTTACIKYAEMVRKGKPTVEWGNPGDRHLHSLFQAFAYGPTRHVWGMLPFASSFNPDHCWLPIPKGDPKCYTLALRFAEPVKSVEVEFTCMLARSVLPPELLPGHRIILPRICKLELEAKVEPGRDSFSFVVPHLSECVGMALVASPCAPNWLIDEVSMLGEGGACVARWGNADIYSDVNRKFGDLKTGADFVATAFCEFGPFMREPDRATTITLGGKFSLRVGTGSVNRSEGPLTYKLNVYMFKHVVFSF
ncbi:hypothetical protein [Medusavirus stheno T3]|uniref:Uncharacterized protein n=1 Tax=Medusavirus stheno T3 TaxID=3069717 RepID=A0A7S7YEI5_9VIRU|nr:hypothetical protein QKU73_gp143 [Acanthamoeba castellanii medusavirus]QPB44324.1 hypothetical protein [Medusavirus stheno T3]